ncbi:MAG: alpha-E domain-containing protein [Sporolactobacillus sp.]|uniref:alpha-E domain-containing protein n=1 Tax=Sporolactobacillus sp. STSJ-5 TaxID=2965076 RepID=UPI002102CC2E|nr:alpha-E domain-containing protein [Sporolactobacillus sp. STSJ-5]MCQ2011655.1 alpha-E domain-containing protein [Sporolactobacillus sp. STSJ-5]
MIGRIAESLYWLGRYLERIENHARLIDVDYHRQSTHTEREQYPWKELIETLADVHAFQEQNLAYNESSVLNTIIFDQANTNSIRSCVTSARGNAQAIRERLPSELWDAINSFHLWLNEQKLENLLIYPHTFFEQIKNQTALFQGIAGSTMLRGQEWQMLQVGKYLERAENTLRILRVVYCQNGMELPYGDALALLKSVSGYEAFRKCLSNKISTNSILEFLMLSPVFPRSTRFSLYHLNEHLAKLSEFRGGISPTIQNVRKSIGKMHAQLDYMDPSEIARTGVADFLDLEVRRCNMIGAAIGQMFSAKGVSVLSF